MKKMTYAEGIREGMRKKMLEDPNVFIFGEDVGKFGGCFGVTMGMFDEFGDKRVRDTPISEGAIIGTAVGSAACGLRPIAELMFMDLIPKSEVYRSSLLVVKTLRGYPVALFYGREIKIYDRRKNYSSYSYTTSGRRRSKCCCTAFPILRSMAYSCPWA